MIFIGTFLECVNYDLLRLTELVFLVLIIRVSNSIILDLPVLLLRMEMLTSDA